MFRIRSEDDLPAVFHHEVAGLEARLSRLSAALAPPRLPSLVAGDDDLAAAQRAARELHGAAGMLGASVFLDSAVEHYRGSFKNQAMVMALASSALNVAVALHGMGSARSDRHPLRTGAYLGAVGVGLLGTGFHFWNVGRRPGGFRWENLFYGAPLGAPAALALSGLLGLSGDRLAGNVRRTGRATLLGQPAGRLVALLTSGGLLGTIGEAGLLHFRGNFQNPAMYIPVTLPPVAAALLAKAALDPKPKARGLARLWLGITAVVGVAGSAFHAYGVSRAMGGWRNWRQNVVDGPPLPAPPSFSGLSIAGIAALRLLSKGRP